MNICLSPDIPFIVAAVYIRFCIVIVALELKSTTRAVRKLIIKFIVKEPWRQNGRKLTIAGESTTKPGKVNLAGFPKHRTAVKMLFVSYAMPR